MIVSSENKLPGSSADRFAPARLRFDTGQISWFSVAVSAFLVQSALCFFGTCLRAQTAHFSGVVTTLYNDSSTIVNPVGVVMDVNNDIFVADSGNEATGVGGGYSNVWELTPNGAGGYNAPVSLAAGSATGPYTYIYGIARDSNGNIWFTDYGCGAAPTLGSAYCTANSSPAGNLWKIPFSGTTYGTPVAIPRTSGTWAAPYGVTADSSGNVFVTDFTNSTVSEVTSGGTSATTLGGSVPSPRRIAVDASGNLYVVSSTGKDVYKLVSPYTTAAVLGTITLNTPVGVAIDSVGNLWVTDPDVNALEELLASSGYTGEPQEFGKGEFSVPVGAGELDLPYDVFSDGNGNFIIADAGNDAIEEVSVNGVNSGQPEANVGTVSRTLQFEFNTAGTIKAPLVLTSGISSLDFVDAGTGTCTTQGTAHSYVSGETCTVNVNFSPKISGSLYGAVDLLNSSGAAIAQGYLYGGGTGPQLIYVAPASDVPAALNSTFGLPLGLAVNRDGSDVFVADSAAGAVDVIVGATKTAIGGSFTHPAGVAVDGAGNVFVADSGSKTISEIPYNGTTWGSAVTLTSLTKGGSSFTFADPLGIAVDSSDNIFVADGSGAAIYEILQASNYTEVNQIASTFTFSSPDSLGFDGDGNLYVADSGAGAIYELTIASKFAAPSGALVSGLTTPTGLAVDGAANLFFISGSKLQELPVGVSLTTLATGLAAPYGIAVDLGRNVYIDSDNLPNNNAVLKLDYVDPPTLSFLSTPYLATSTDSPQLLIVENIGTGSGSAITFSANPAVTTTTAGAGGSFTSDASTTCSSTTSLAGSAAGSICNVGVDFTPQAVEAIAGTVTLTDSYTGSPQTIDLSGTGTKESPTISWSTAPPASAAYNSQFTVAATSNSTGAITYSVTGGCTNNLGVVTMTSGTTACAVSVSVVADSNYAAGTLGPTSVTATKATPTVSWSTAPPASAAYNSQFTVVATSNSTGAITYSVTGGCTNNLGVVTMTSGTTACAVSASAVADANYTAGTVGPTSVTATLATPTVSWSTAPPASAAYNSQFTVVATSNSTGTITYSVTGGCTNNLGVVTMTSGTTACAVSASAVADANYTAGTVGPTSVTATLATPTVSWSTAPPASAAYNSQFTVVATSNSTGTITYSVTGGCTNNLGVVTMTSGTTACAVSASAVADANYTAGTVGPTSVTATLATPTVSWSTAPPASAVYNSQFTVAATSNSTGLITYSTTGGCTNSLGVVTMTSGTTACAVSASVAADLNYAAGTVGPTSVTATLAPQIITFTPPSSPVTYGVSPITLSANSTSGLPVTLSVDPSSTATGNFSGDLLTITSAGTLVIDASQLGSTDYQAATPVQNTIIVDPASYIVTSIGDDAGSALNCTPQTTPDNGTDASCSLRDAMLETAATGGGNVTFDSTKFASATTITLSNGTLTIPSTTSIVGPTTGTGATLANLVTVDGSNTSTVFTVGSGVTGASIANLTIQHGNGVAGGIQNAGTLTLTSDTVANNSGSGSGAGVSNSGILTLSASTVSSNVAAGNGGGVANSGTLTLSDDTVSGNTSSASGAGIYNSATLTVSDSTVSGNGAATASSGGGIDDTGSGTVALANSIVSGNTSNSTVDDFDGTAYADNGGNVVGVVNGTTVNATAINLAPLGSYGGPTQTLIPFPGSPAICAGLAAGIPSGLTTDQRGLPNTNTTYPSYSACVDAGAVQTNYALSFSTEPTSSTAANTNFAAGVTLTESGNPFQPTVTIPLTLTGTGTLSGGSAATSAGVASYTLQVDTIGTGDTLTANLVLNSALSPAVAISTISNTFNVGIATPTVGLSLSQSSVAYGTQVMFTATVPAAATGSVTFYNNGTTALSAPITVSGGTATFSISTLPAGSYSITASYSGDSNYSSATSGPQSLTINQATATISISNIPSSAVYNGSFTPAYTYSGSGAPTESVSSTTPAVCTVTGGTVNFVGVGTCALAAAATQTTDYLAATGTSQTFSVSQAAQTITFSPSSPVAYGVGPITLSATGGASGNPVTFSFVSGPASLNGSTLTVTGVGTIAIDANQAGNADYSAATQVSQSIAVNQAALTASANNASRVYGTANPAFTGAVMGAVNGDSFTESFSTSATTASNAGSYQIVPSVTGANLADYSVTAQDGTLTVAQAGTTTSLSVSSGSISPGQSVTLTAQVASATTGTPTGSVNFYDGTTLLNTAALSGGTASFATTSLSAGTTHQLTAVYSGDVNFLTSTTSASTPIVVSSLDFSITPQAPTSQTVNAGGSAAYQLTVAPLNGSYPASVTFAASGLPAGATVSFSPPTIAANGGQQTVTMTVQTALTSTLHQAVPEPLTGRRLQPFALAFLLLLGIGGMRRHGRNLRRAFYVVLLLAGGAVTLLTGCGGHTNSSTSQTPETYTVTVTASSGNLQHTATVTLVVE